MIKDIITLNWLTTSGGTLKQYHSHKVNTQYVHLCSAHTSNIFSWNRSVMMFSVGLLPLLLKSISQFLQVPWGIVSLLDLITEQCPHVFNWADVRGLCRPVHHINLQHLISRNAVQTLAVCKSSVCTCWNISTPRWFCMNSSHLLQDFVPVPTLHWGSPGSWDQYGAIQKPHPTPYEMHPSISVCFTDAWVCQSFVSSFPHSLSSINPLKHEPAFHLASESDSEFDSEYVSGLSHPGAQRRNDKMWK